MIPIGVLTLIPSDPSLKKSFPTVPSKIDSKINNEIFNYIKHICYKVTPIKKDAEIYGGTKLARDLLSVLDNLNRALESVDDEMVEKQNAVLEGIELTKKELLNTFSNHEINELAPEVGEKFDPKFHQAMFEGPHPNIEKGNIIQVMANGFTIGDRLLRAASVGVSSGAVENKEEES